MKKRSAPAKFVFFFIAMMFSVAAGSAFAQETKPFSINDSPLPAPTGFVNDYAGVIDAATKQQLESKLKNLKDTTNPSVELAVAVVKTTGDRDIFDYSLAVARGWKIGSKADNNPSPLLFIAIDDRKYFTQAASSGNTSCLNSKKAITAKAFPTPSMPTSPRSATRATLPCPPTKIATLPAGRAPEPWADCSLISFAAAS